MDSNIITNIDIKLTDIVARYEEILRLLTQTLTA